MYNSTCHLSLLSMSSIKLQDETIRLTDIVSASALIYTISLSYITSNVHRPIGPIQSLDYPPWKWQWKSLGSIYSFKPLALILPKVYIHEVRTVRTGYVINCLIYNNIIYIIRAQLISISACNPCIYIYRYYIRIYYFIFYLQNVLSKIQLLYLIR